MKKLSIIIPNYNSKITLLRLLESIEWNDETEVIVVDDNSSKSQFDIKEMRLLFPNGIFIKNYRKKGAGGARNCGIDIANGTFLMFVDSDDFLTPNYFKILRNSLIDDLDIFYFYPTSRNEKTHKKGNRHKIYLDRLKEYEITLRREILFRIYVPWSKVFNKQFIHNNNINFEEVPASNDVMFSLKTAFYAKKVRVINQEIYVTTETPNSLTNTPSLKNLESRFHVAIRFNKFLKANGYLRELTPMAPHIHSFFKHVGLTSAIKILFISLKQNQPIFLGIKHFSSIFRHLKSSK